MANKEMVKIKIDETYSIGLQDRLNIVLVKYGPVMVPKKVNGKVMKVQHVVDGKLQVDKKGNPVMRVAEWEVSGYKDEIIGTYGRSFSALVQGMIYNKISDTTVKSIEELDQYVKNFVESINFDGIIKDFHKKVIELQNDDNVRKVREYREKLKTVRKERDSLKISYKEAIDKIKELSE